MASRERFQSPALQFLHDRYIGKDSQRAASLEEERANAEIARKVFDLRTKAKLTVRQLAQLVGTTVLVIRQLEDGDYEGHTFAMLRRIAAALNKRVEMRFVSVKPKLRQA